MMEDLTQFYLKMHYGGNKLISVTFHIALRNVINMVSDNFYYLTHREHVTL
jgi:phosphopantetheine adenylyltransferase